MLWCHSVSPPSFPSYCFSSVNKIVREPSLPIINSLPADFASLVPIYCNCSAFVDKTLMWAKSDVGVLHIRLASKGIFCLSNWWYLLSRSTGDIFYSMESEGRVEGAMELVSPLLLLCTKSQIACLASFVVSKVCTCGYE